MKRLVIIGSGDLGHQVAYHAKSSGLYEPIGFLDDMQEEGAVRHHLPVLGKTAAATSLFNAGMFDEIFIAIGYKHFATRQQVFEDLSPHIPFATIVHPSAYVDPGCILGKGVIIYPGCVLDMQTVIGHNVLLNAGCVIAHDSHVGSHSFLSPAVSVAGFVEIGSCVSLGIGTIVIDGVKIASHVRTGAGAVIIDDIDIPGLYVGVPAKFKKAL